MSVNWGMAVSAAFVMTTLASDTAAVGVTAGVAVAPKLQPLSATKTTKTRTTWIDFENLFI
jgi:hypothetical protein